MPLPAKMLVGILIGLFWGSMFFISLNYPTTNVKLLYNISKEECFEMGCSYQPRPETENYCVCLIE